MPSANDIIDGALRYAKLTAELQPVDPYKVERGREIFNDVVSAWGASAMYIPLQSNLTLELAANQSRYVVGLDASYDLNTSPIIELMEVTIQDPDSDSIYYDVRIINEPMYANIIARTSTGIPSMVLLRRYQTFSELYFQAVPWKTFNCYLLSKQRLETVSPTQIDINYGIIPEFASEALKFKIAKRLMHVFGKNITAEFSRDHDLAVNAFAAANVTVDPYAKKDVRLSRGTGWTVYPGGY